MYGKQKVSSIRRTPVASPTSPSNNSTLPSPLAVDPTFSQQNETTQQQNETTQQQNEIKYYIPPNDDDEYTTTSYNHQELLSKLNLLFSMKDMKISELSAEAKAMYDSIVELVRVLYGTDEYKIFYKTIQEVFSNCTTATTSSTSSTEIGNDTVAAYFIGCSITTSVDPQGCNIICANAIPSPDVPVCQHLLVVGVYNGTKYTFVTLNNVKTTQCILFVNELVEFTEVDIKALTDLSITKVSIYKAIDNALLTDGFVELSSLTKIKSKFWIKTPTDPSNSITTTNTKTMASNGPVIAISIIVVVIVVLIVVILLDVFTDYLPVYTYT